MPGTTLVGHQDNGPGTTLEDGELEDGEVHDDKLQELEESGEASGCESASRDERHTHSNRRRTDQRAQPSCAGPQAIPSRSSSPPQQQLHGFQAAQTRSSRVPDTLTLPGAVSMAGDLKARARLPGQEPCAIGRCATTAAEDQTQSQTGHPSAQLQQHPQQCSAPTDREAEELVALLRDLTRSISFQDVMRSLESVSRDLKQSIKKLDKLFRRVKKRKGDSIADYPSCFQFSKRILEGLHTVNKFSQTSAYQAAPQSAVEASYALFRAAMNYRHDVFNSALKTELETLVRNSKAFKVVLDGRRSNVGQQQQPDGRTNVLGDGNAAAAASKPAGQGGQPEAAAAPAANAAAAGHGVAAMPVDVGAQDEAGGSDEKAGPGHAAAPSNPEDALLLQPPYASPTPVTRDSPQQPDTADRPCAALHPFAELQRPSSQAETLAAVETCLETGGSADGADRLASQAAGNGSGVPGSTNSGNSKSKAVISTAGDLNASAAAICDQGIRGESSRLSGKECVSPNQRAHPESANKCSHLATHGAEVTGTGRWSEPMIIDISAGGEPCATAAATADTSSTVAVTAGLEDTHSGMAVLKSTTGNSALAYAAGGALRWSEIQGVGGEGTLPPPPESPVSDANMQDDGCVAEGISSGSQRQARTGGVTQTSLSPMLVKHEETLLGASPPAYVAVSGSSAGLGATAIKTEAGEEVGDGGIMTGFQGSGCAVDGSDKERGRKRDRNSDRDRTRDRTSTRDKDRDGKEKEKEATTRDKDSYSREKDRERDREREKEKDKDRDRDKDKKDRHRSSKDKDREREKEKASDTAGTSHRCLRRERDLAPVQAPSSGLNGSTIKQEPGNGTLTAVTNTSSVLTRHVSDEVATCLGRGRLVLVVDLDGLLADSCWDSTLDGCTAATLERRAMMESSGTPEDRRELFRLQLDRGAMWIKLRPGARSFLSRASERFELWARTSQGRAYADAVVELLDPSQQLFGSRVMVQGVLAKRLLTALDVRAPVAVVLDTPDAAWMGEQLTGNLLAVPPYSYFAHRTCTAGGPSSAVSGMGGKSLLELDRDECPDRGVLAAALVPIEALHSQVLQLYNGTGATSSAAAPHPSETAPAAGGMDDSLPPWDVRNVLRQLRARILAGIQITFSRVLGAAASSSQHPLWRLAESCGATCSVNYSEGTTHVISLGGCTEKVVWAQQNGRFVVHPSWLECSCYMWRKADEALFLV